MSDIMRDKMGGKAKEMAGKASDNKKLEMKGKVQHATGEVRQKAKNALDEVSHKIDH